MGGTSTAPSKSSAFVAPRLGRGQQARPAAAVAPRDGARALRGALDVAIEQLAPDPGQPRKTFDPDRLEELADSIKEHGLLHPLVVREDGYLDDARERYLLVAGERRYRAAQMAGLTRLPVLVRDSDEATARFLQVIENVQREGLNPVEEARAYRELMDLRGLSTRDVAAKVGRSQPYVAERLTLLAHEDVAEAVGAGAVARAVGIEIAREQDADARTALLEEARAGRLREQDVQARRKARQATTQQATQQTQGTPPQEQTIREAGAALHVTDEATLHRAAEAWQAARAAQVEMSAGEAVMLAASSPASAAARPSDDSAAIMPDAEQAENSNETAQGRRSVTRKVEPGGPGDATYDASVDALYVHVARGRHGYSVSYENGVVIDYASDGRALGVEVIGVTALRAPTGNRNLGSEEEG